MGFWKMECAFSHRSNADYQRPANFRSFSVSDGLLLNTSNPFHERLKQVFEPGRDGSCGKTGVDESGQGAMSSDNISSAFSSTAKTRTALDGVQSVKKSISTLQALCLKTGRLTDQLLHLIGGLTHKLCHLMDHRNDTLSIL